MPTNGSAELLDVIPLLSLRAKLYCVLWEAGARWKTGKVITNRIKVQSKNIKKIFEEVMCVLRHAKKKKRCTGNGEKKGDCVCVQHVTGLVEEKHTECGIGQQGTSPCGHCPFHRRSGKGRWSPVSLCAGEQPSWPAHMVLSLPHKEAWRCTSRSSGEVLPYVSIMNGWNMVFSL